MLEAVRHCLSNLTSFDGRDSRQTFWFYVLALVILNVAISTLASVPMMAGMMEGVFRGIGSGIPEEAITEQMMAEMGAWIETTIWISVATGVLMAALVIAAMVRRIHDSGHSGWWVILPLAAQLASLAITVSLIDEMRDFMTVATNPENLEAIVARQQRYALYGLVGWIPLLFILVFGLLKPTEGPNRYGDQPVRT